MKTAKVIPIYKSGNKDNIQNYRPISLLPTFSKILERLMYNKLYSYFNAKKMFYNHQYGFRQRHSTIHPIIQMLNDCAINNNKNIPELTLAIFCDLSKAFDVIDHNILLKKLEIYGICGVTNSWFRNYLSDRTQFVTINGINST